MSSLKQKTISALAWDFLGKFSTQGVTFVISIFLARILSPEDFGIVGMALVFIGISYVFADVGFSHALIQAKENTDLSYSSVFWLNLIISCFLFFLFQFLAPAIASFYEIPIIENLVKWLSLIIPLNAISSVQTAILKRELKFKSLSLRIFLAGLFSGVIGVCLALKGYGVYSLVAQSLTSSAIMAVVLWSVSNWRPQFKFSTSALNQLFGFSKYVFFSQTLAQILSKLDALIIGKLFSAELLGFFTRSKSLSNLVVKYSAGTINSVFFPVLSKLQNDLKRFRAVFLRVLSLTSFLSFLLSGVLILSGEAIIITLFGEKWAPSVFIFHILMLRLFNYPLNVIIVGAYLALGKSKENFWHGNIRKAMTLCTFLVAFSGNFEWFLYSLVFFSFLSTLYNNIIISRELKIKFWKQFIQIVRPGIIFLLLLFMLTSLPPMIDNLIGRSLLYSIVFSLLFIALNILVNSELLSEIRSLLRNGKRMFSKKQELNAV